LLKSGASADVVDGFVFTSALRRLVKSLKTDPCASLSLALDTLLSWKL
jgi:hypothetical protein